CLEELVRARESVAALPRALAPVAPPRGVWPKIESQLRAAAPPATRPRRLWPLAVPALLLVAAASVAIVAVAGRAGTARDAAAACQAQLDAQRAALRLLELPATRVVPLVAQAGDAGAVAIVNLERGKAAVVAHGLVPQDGRDYELWVVRGTEKRAAGLLRGDAGGAGSVLVDEALLAGGVGAFAGTLQPPRGGPAPPRPLLLLGVVKT